MNEKTWDAVERVLTERRERSCKNRHLGRGDWHRLRGFMAQGLSAPSDGLCPANARRIAQVHVANLDRIERFDRGGDHFGCPVGRVHGCGGSNFISVIFVL